MFNVYRQFKCYNQHFIRYLDIKTLILLNLCCMDQSHRETISYKNLCNMSNPCRFIEKAGGFSSYDICTDVIQHLRFNIKTIDNMIKIKQNFPHFKQFIVSKFEIDNWKANMYRTIKIMQRFNLFGLTIFTLVYIIMWSSSYSVPSYASPSIDKRIKRA